MKKIFLILYFFPCLASAQFIGIKGGLSISNDYSGMREFLFSPTYGIVYSKFKEKSRFTFEPSYNTKGTYDKAGIGIVNGVPVTDVRDVFRYSYIELPFTYGWLPIDKKIFLGIHGGLAPAFLVKASYMHSNSISPRRYYKIRTYSKFNIDIIGGIENGVRITENLFVAFNLRYGTSLFNIDGTRFFYISPSLEIGYKPKQKKK